MPYLWDMRRFVLTISTACLLAFPALSQEAPKEDGTSLMEEGARLFLKGILQEMEPALEDLRGFAEEIQPKLQDFMQEMGPALADILSKIDDLSAYHAPEMLPNGDIIIRRKTPQELLDERNGEIEL
jgi:hypothetical protein